MKRADVVVIDTNARVGTAANRDGKLLEFDHSKLGSRRSIEPDQSQLHSSVISSAHLTSSQNSRSESANRQHSAGSLDANSERFGASRSRRRSFSGTRVVASDRSGYLARATSGSIPAIRMIARTPDTAACSASKRHLWFRPRWPTCTRGNAATTKTSTTETHG